MWLESSSHLRMWEVAIHVSPQEPVPSQSTWASAHLLCHATHTLLMRTWDYNRHHRRRGKAVRGKVPFPGNPLTHSYCGICHTTYSLLSLPMIGTITWQPKYLACLLSLDGKYNDSYSGISYAMFCTLISRNSKQSNPVMRAHKNQRENISD